MAKKELDKPTKKEEDWMSKKWRPMMAIMYMMVCIFDFIVFPIMFTVVQFWEVSAANDAFRQWNPITLLGGGLFHVAMGAVLGVSAWSRGQEKIAGVAGGNNATPQLPSPTAGTSTFGVSTPTTNSWGSQSLGSGSGFGGASTTSTSFGGSSGFGTPASSEVVTGFGGKPAPVIPPFPER